ncbi:PAS domain S-box protein [uncultured Hyphomicrobium sp.]|uniref:PAS domain S-box protein n=1 Tax=uncultured Hyphomicrobium sp. TaxID=194373 RepID=UPI0025D017BD|nr:PAS domain S-box protein [uncultured Hyphomicrobium sp.]
MSQALDEEHDQYRQALEFSRLGFWSWDAASDRVTFSERAAEIFGVPLGPAMTWTELRGLLLEPDRELARVAVEAAIAGRSDYAISYRVKRPADDKTIWVEARGRAHYSGDSVLGMIGTVEDATARKVQEDVLADERRSLEVLNRTQAMIAAELDLSTLVQAVTDAAVELTRAEFGAFFYNVKNAEGESYTLYTLSGAPREAFARFPMPRNTAVFAPTFEGKGIVRSDDILTDPRYGKNEPYHGMPDGHLPVRSYLAAPVVSRSGQVLGGLFFGHHQPGIFDQRAESVLAGIAAQAAVAIDNARLYRSAQEELRVRRLVEDRYRMLVETLPQLVWSCLPDGTCNHLSRQWLEYTGLPAAEQIGFGWLDMSVHSEDRARVLEHWMGAVNGEHDYDIDFRIRRHDGAYRWFKARASPVRDEHGTIVQWFGSSTDIEDIVQARELQFVLRNELESKIAQRTEELRTAYTRLVAEVAEREKAEGHYQLLVEGVSDYAIFMLDSAGHITNWNNGAERIKGYRAAEIVGQHFSVFYTEEDRANGVPPRGLETAARTGKFETEGWRVRKDGSRFWANVVINAIRDRNGNLVAFAKITRDATERREAETALQRAQEQLAQSQKMEGIGQLTGGVAHDFNNLLTIILGNLQSVDRTLAKGKVDPERILRLTHNAKQGAERAAALTQRLLAFSRRQPLDPKTVDAGRLVVGISELLRRAIGEQIALETVLAGGLWRVHVDANQLEVSLLNLAVNARDAMPNGGKLTIETANAYLDERYASVQAEVRPGQYVVICMTDTGSGMTKEVLARAFEPFFTTKDIGQGTGLGLSQVYGFVKQSGGHVKIYTEAGEGTTVKIYLPRMLANDLSAHEGSPKEPVNPTGNETILLVEDEDDVRAYSREILSELGYSVVEASNGHAALRLLDAHPEIDLLFTDVGLPHGMSGRQLADEAILRRPQIKVLFTSGYARNAISHNGHLKPGVHLLTKPFTYEMLAEKLRAVLDDGPIAP